MVLCTTHVFLANSNSFSTGLSLSLLHALTEQVCKASQITRTIMTFKGKELVFIQAVFFEGPIVPQFWGLYLCGS